MLDSYEIKPYSEVASISYDISNNKYPLEKVLPVIGMNEYFVTKVVGKCRLISEEMVLELLEQDMFSETFVPRSKIIP